MLGIDSFKDFFHEVSVHVLCYFFRLTTEETNISTNDPMSPNEVTNPIGAPAAATTTNHSVLFTIKYERRTKIPSITICSIFGFICRIKSYKRIKHFTFYKAGLPVTVECLADNVHLIVGCEMFTKTTFYVLHVAEGKVDKIHVE